MQNLRLCREKQGMGKTVTQSCPTLCDPMDFSLPGSSIHVFFFFFFRQEYWSGLLFIPPGDLPDPEIEPMSLASPALTGGFFVTEAPGNIGEKYIIEGFYWENGMRFAQRMLCEK